VLHLLGVSHFAQARKAGIEKTEPQKAFCSFLKQIIQDVHPIFLTEKQSEENLANQEIISIPKEISDSERIEHRFCDPNSAERRAMGYLGGADILSRNKSLLGSNLP